MLADIRGGRATAGVVALVTVLAALVLVAASLGTTPQRAAAAGVARDASPGGPRALSRIVVIDHNIENRASALDVALRRAARAEARLITLQEVCWWQVRGLREKHPTWSISYQPDFRTGRCRQGFGVGSIADRNRSDSGNVAIWTGGRRAKASSHIFRSQAGKRFNQGLTCLHFRVGIKVDLCSTHLVHDGKIKSRKVVQVRQARQVKKITRRLTERGHLVVIGGDFNSSPRSRPMDFLFQLNGQGRYVEATECQPTVLRCRRSRGITFDQGKQKIDYIFFSANRLPPGAPHGLSLTRTLSDHHLLTGWAYVDARPKS